MADINRWPAAIELSWSLSLSTKYRIVRWTCDGISSRSRNIPDHLIIRST